MKLIVIFVLSVFIGALQADVPMFSLPLSPRIANYDIDVQLDVQNKQLDATEKLNWHNTSPDTIYDLHFHMYLNAFKNNQSTFVRESGGMLAGNKIDGDKGWGWIRITYIGHDDGEDLSDRISYIQPDDQNSHDETVLKVDLDRPILPGQSIDLTIKFMAKLPIVFARTGYYEDFFMVGQWFPKIGVWEHREQQGGAWNCHQFHRNSEFFADYGVYSVRITLPETYITGATGILLDETSNPDGTKTVTYYCEDVHDFAWTADPDYSVIEDQWKHVTLRYLCQPMRAHNVERYIESAKFALAYLEEWVGPYPYPVLTIVDPQYGALGAAGMEYPTLITAGNHWLMPEGVKFPEEVTVHEFAHNYFYGLLGSNEFEEAWLDEGMTTYSHVKIMENYFPDEAGSAIDLWGLKVDEPQYIWLLYTRNPKQDKIYKRSWEYTRGGYGTFSYYKPALMLLTLENYLGETKMKEVWHTYYDRFSFRHPSTEDFICVVNEVCGEDMNWFLEPVIYGTDVLDYAIDAIKVKPVHSRQVGIFGDPLITGADSLKDPRITENDSDTVYKSKVIVSREGELKFPVEIAVYFEDGEEIVEYWDGIERYKVFTYERSSRVSSAQIDPERKIWLDVNFLNNGMSHEDQNPAQSKYTWRWLFWMQNLLQYLLFLS